MIVFLVKDWKRINGQILLKKTIVDIYRKTAIELIHSKIAIALETKNINDKILVLCNINFESKNENYIKDNYYLINIKHQKKVSNLIENGTFTYIQD